MRETFWCICNSISYRRKRGTTFYISHRDSTLVSWWLFSQPDVALEANPILIEETLCATAWLFLKVLYQHLSFKIIIRRCPSLSFGDIYRDGSLIQATKKWPRLLSLLVVTAIVGHVKKNDEHYSRASGCTLFTLYRDLKSHVLLNKY